MAAQRQLSSAGGCSACKDQPNRSPPCRQACAMTPNRRAGVSIGTPIRRPNSQLKMGLLVLVAEEFRPGAVGSLDHDSQCRQDDLRSGAIPNAADHKPLIEAIRRRLIRQNL